MAENSPETPQVKNIWPDFGGYVDKWSRVAYSTGLRAGIRQERARCAAIAAEYEKNAEQNTNADAWACARDYPRRDRWRRSMSWQQMHDGLFWPRYAPLLPVPRPDGAHEMIAAAIRLERLYRIGCAHGAQGDPATSLPTELQETRAADANTKRAAVDDPERKPPEAT